jgi:hypothetical protein
VSADDVDPQADATLLENVPVDQAQAPSDA